MANVIIRDRGWGRIKNNLDKVHSRKIGVGVQAGSGEVLDYAIYNEFGTRSIPARPFMQHSVIKHEKAIDRLMQGLATRVIDGRINVDRALGMAGEWFANKIQEEIANSPSWAKPNAPSTVARKGSSVPLIQHGVLRQAIRWEYRR